MRAVFCFPLACFAVLMTARTVYEDVDPHMNGWSVPGLFSNSETDSPSWNPLGLDLVAAVIFLRQDPEPDVFELDGGTLRFKAEVAFGGVAVRSARNLFAIDPKAHFAVDGSDVVVVPLVDAFGETFGREAAPAVWGDRWKGFHFGWSSGEDVTVGGEPIRRFPFIFFPVGLVSKVENLDFDAIGEATFPGGKFLDGSGAGPSENAGVARVFFVHPLADEFEVFGGLLHANDAYWIAGAGGMPAFPGPGFGIAIDIHKVLAGELTPPLPGAVDKGLFYVGIRFDFRLLLIREAEGDKETEEDGSENRLVAGIFQNHGLAIRRQDRNLVGILNEFY